MRTLSVIFGTAALLVTANVMAADYTDQAQDQSMPGNTPYQSQNIDRGDQTSDQETYTDQGTNPNYEEQNVNPNPQERNVNPNYPPNQAPGAAGWNTQRIDQTTGLRGRLTRSGVYILRVPPRLSCLSVGGLRLPTSMAPTSTIAFKRAGGTTFVSGDLVLLQNQVNPVIDAALNSGLQVTGLHDPFLWDSPRVMLLHFTGTGDTNRLANGVSRILSSTGFRGAMGAEMRESGTYGRSETMGGATCSEESCPQSTCSEGTNVCEEGTTETYSAGTGACPAINDGSSDLANSGVEPNQFNLDRRQVQDILGIRGFERNGILKFNYPKITRWNGQQMGWAMGVKSEIAFAGSNDRAIVSGDLAVYPNDLQNVLRSLRQANINILTIGSHLAGEQPRVVFVHFLGTGRATDLAHGIRNAVEASRPGAAAFRQFRQQGQPQAQPGQQPSGQAPRTAPPEQQQQQQTPAPGEEY